MSYTRHETEEKYLVWGYIYYILCTQAATTYLDHSLPTSVHTGIIEKYLSKVRIRKHLFDGFLKFTYNPVM